MMKSKHFALFQLLKGIRSFFDSEDFLEVATPALVSNPGMEVHIHPFQVASARTGKSRPLYLHTSPEFHMKELLSEGFERIFNLGYCFRDEQDSPIHRNQFLMLEWYRGGERYEKIMDDTLALIKDCEKFLRQKGIATNETITRAAPIKKTVAEVFKEYLSVDILDYLDHSKLRQLIATKFPDVPLPPEGESKWDDDFFLLFLNRVEPHFKEIPLLVLYEFPAPLAALSTIKENDPRVCERFEIYVQGIELCNCFNELTDLQKQVERFKQQAEEKEELYGYKLPEPEVLYQALRKGLPSSAGNALGVERLLKALTGIDNPFYH